MKTVHIVLMSSKCCTLSKIKNKNVEDKWLQKQYKTFFKPIFIEN